jgi:hypothetical protein
VAVVPSDEEQPVPFPDGVIVREADTPIEGYKISTKIETMTVAEEFLNTRPLCLLDSDVILTDRLTLPEHFDISAKPVDNGGFSESIWRRLYEQQGWEVPNKRVTSTFGGVQMYPYYNAGVVISNVDAFGAKWRELTRWIVSDEAEIEDTRYADQIALGMLSTLYDVSELTEDQNFPLVLRPYPPKSVEAIHYHNPLHLLKAFHKRHFIKEIGLDELMPYKWNSPKVLLGLAKAAHGTVIWRRK